MEVRQPSGFSLELLSVLFLQKNNPDFEIIPFPLPVKIIQIPAVVSPCWQWLEVGQRGPVSLLTIWFFLTLLSVKTLTVFWRSIVKL